MGGGDGLGLFSGLLQTRDSADVSVNATRDDVSVKLCNPLK